MYACMYVCMYACMYVCLFVCMYLCMYAYMYIDSALCEFYVAGVSFRLSLLCACSNDSANGVCFRERYMGHAENFL
jgi:hypothetical protein